MSYKNFQDVKSATNLSALVLLECNLEIKLPPKLYKTSTSLIMEDAQSNLGGVSWFFPMYKGEHNNFKKEQYG